MSTVRDELQRRLDVLEANMPFLTKELSTPGAVRAELVSYAGEMLKDAGADDEEWVYAQINRVLDNFAIEPIDSGRG